jgi:hypothetical protein
MGMNPNGEGELLAISFEIPKNKSQEPNKT